jgi:hypothetical protein
VNGDGLDPGAHVDAVVGFEEIRVPGPVSSPFVATTSVVAAAAVGDAAATPAADVTIATAEIASTVQGDLSRGKIFGKRFLQAGVHPAGTARQERAIMPGTHEPPACHESGR